jgi:prevent-host-death family protein
MYILFGGIMIEVSATKLRNNLFEFLTKVSKGETISVKRNGEDVAFMVPPKKEDWRDKMRTKVKFLVPPDKAFAPMEDVWEDYL